MLLKRIVVNFWELRTNRLSNNEPTNIDWKTVAQARDRGHTDLIL